MNIGIIGVGVRGESLSYLINKYFKKQLKIVALCDLIEDKSNKVKSGINDNRINLYKNAKNLINNEKLDGLIITSHTDQHYKHAKLAAEKNIKSMLDKPISVSLKHAKEIVELERRNKFQFLMSFTRRYEASFTVWVLTTFMKGVPKEIEEAAIVDVASSFLILRKIFLPIMTPAIFTTTIMAMIAVWNEFLFALTFTATNSDRTITVGIALINGTVEYEVPWGSIMAASVIVTVPPVIITLLLQGRIMSGLTAGSIKG